MTRQYNTTQERRTAWAIAKNVETFCKARPSTTITYYVTHSWDVSPVWSSRMLSRHQRWLKERGFSGVTVAHQSANGRIHYHLTVDIGVSARSNRARHIMQSIRADLRRHGFGRETRFTSFFGDGIAWGRYLANGFLDLALRRRNNAQLRRFRAFRKFGSIEVSFIRSTDFQLNGPAQRRWRQRLTLLAGVAGVAIGDTSAFLRSLGRLWFKSIGALFDDMESRFGRLHEHWPRHELLDRWLSLSNSAI